MPEYWKTAERRLPGLIRRLATWTAVALLPLLPTSPVASNCEPARPGQAYYSFLRPELIDPFIVGAPYLIGFQELYERYGRAPAIQRQDNVTEWRARFCNVPREKDIATLIYETSALDLERLRSAIGSRTIPLPPLLSANSFARYLARFQCTEVVDYLVYAKRCEPHVTQRDPWDDTPRNVPEMERLIEEGLRRFLSLESHYIRLRYAYQIIRLAHYARRYERTLELYDYLMPKIDHDPSLIEFWIEGHRAGALLALGDKVRASYLYARVFLNCPSRRESALLSYRLTTDEEWKQCLLLCRDDRERAALYAMRAYGGGSRAVEDMRRIYELDPQSEHLEPLLVKAMAEAERLLLGRDLPTPPRRFRNATVAQRTAAGEEVIELQRLARRVVNDRLVDRPDFWAVAEGYLELLAGDYYAARQTFREAAGLVRNDNLRRQLNVFDLLLRISGWTTVDDAVEQEVVRIQRGDLYREFPDFQPYLNGKLQDLYLKNNRPGKAFISRYPPRLLKPNPQADILEDLVRVCRKETPTRLEVNMVRNDTGGTILSDLLDIQATLLFGNYQLEAALETLKQMNRSEWDNYGLFNPFAERLNDCVHCFLPDTLQAFNRGELIEQLLDLEYRARADLDNAAAHYYRLGVAFYNMTYFSYAWQAMDYFRSGASLSPRNLRDGDEVIPHASFPFGNREHFDCSQALYYFLKARQLAKDPELAARATFWAAKCERNAYYVKRVGGAPRTYEYFTDLRSRYANTNYYQRVITECKTFAAFATR